MSDVSTASGASATAQDSVRQQVDQRAKQAGDQVSGTADDLRSVGEELRKQGKDGPAKLADRAAEQTEKVGSYLSSTGPDRMLHDAEDIGRERPWALLGGGLVLGAVAARFLEASSRGPLSGAFARRRLLGRRAAGKPRGGVVSSANGEGGDHRSQSSGELVKQLSEQITTPVRQEIELAKAAGGSARDPGLRGPGRRAGDGRKAEIEAGASSEARANCRNRQGGRAMGQEPEQIRREIEETRGEMGETVDALAYRADVKTRVKDSIADKRDRLVGRAQGTTGKVGEATPDGRQLEEGAHRAVGIAEENPIGLALAGVAGGFLAGMLLPSTKMEDERVGPLADQVEETAVDTGKEALDRGKEVAGEVAEQAVEGAKEVGQQAVETARESGQEQAEKLEESAKEGAREINERGLS